MDWNVVLTVHDGAFERAEDELRDLGEVARTEYYNVLVMRVEEIAAFLQDLSGRARMIPDLMESCLARVSPARSTVDFQTAEEFEEKGRAVVRELAPELEGRSFHVRMHRRGFGESLHSGEMERRFAAEVYDVLEEAGKEEPKVDFDDPERVLAVETVSNRAGISLWSREDLERYPFLDPD